MWEEKDLPLTKSQWNYPTYDEKFQLVERSRAKKLDNLRDVLMGYLDEIMPVKSGSNYRLQFLTDQDLCDQISQFLVEEHGVKVGNSTILKFLKKNTKRSHVSKPDGCLYCHALQHCPDQLTPDQKVEYVYHRELALVCPLFFLLPFLFLTPLFLPHKSQAKFKKELMNAISADDRTILVSMDFSKFDLSEKCKSIEGHIIVLRYGPKLARDIGDESKAIGGLHRKYMTVLGKTHEFKHTPGFVYESFLK